MYTCFRCSNLELAPNRNACRARTAAALIQSRVPQRLSLNTIAVRRLQNFIFISRSSGALRVSGHLRSPQRPPAAQITNSDDCDSMSYCSWDATLDACFNKGEPVSCNKYSTVGRARRMKSRPPFRLLPGHTPLTCHFHRRVGGRLRGPKRLQLGD